MERLEQQIQFLLEVDKVKNITRQTYIADGSRPENDAEHSWSLALMAFLLSEHANEDVDVLHVMQMVIIHDLVEIDAGDTYAYDEAGNETKRQRELQAAERLFGILPEDQGKWMRSLWDEFEEGKTKEAIYAATLDRVQPLLLNDITGGFSWRDHQVCQDQIIKRNEITPKGSKALWDYCKKVIDRNVEEGNIRR